MQKKLPLVTLAVLSGVLAMLSESAWAQSDVIKTSKGDLRITPIYHASLMLQFDNKVIYVDPINIGDYSGKPKADLILVTHDHPDHMNRARIDSLETDKTVVVAAECVTLARLISEAKALHNGEKTTVFGIEIEAIPAYNLTRGPSGEAANYQVPGPKQGKFYHPNSAGREYECSERGQGIGFVLTMGGKRVYISGDTECIPEIKALKDIDVAFVCMNLPYTMPPGEAAECVNSFRPKIVYPYHYDKSNLEEFTKAVMPGIEVRLRKWY